MVGFRAGVRVLCEKKTFFIINFLFGFFLRNLIKNYKLVIDLKKGVLVIRCVILLMCVIGVGIVFGF